MRIRHLVALVALVALAPAGARASNPLTQDPCPGGVDGPTVWTQLGNDVLENLLFSHDSLFVSDQTAGSIRRFDAAKYEDPADAVEVSGPGGLTEGPDGLIYAGTGDSVANALTRNGAASVIRFDPADPAGTMQIYASGFNMANGMTWGPGDDLFISNDFDTGLIRIPRDPTKRWSLVNDAWGTNGLVVSPDGKTLYSNVTFDSRSPIEATDLTTGAHQTAVQLTFGAASLQPAVYTDGDQSRPLNGAKGLDDLTIANGILYPVANGGGELLRVNPETGDACLIASGLQTPSSVRIAPEYSGFDDGDPATIDFFITEFSGAIKTVRYAPPQA